MSAVDGLPVTSDTGAEIVPVPEPVPEVPKEIVLSPTDRLQAEVLSLQVQNVSLQKERFVMGANRQVEMFDNRLNELKASITEFQRHLSTVYGIDFTKQQIEPGTGRIIPAPGSVGPN